MDPLAVVTRNNYVESVHCGYVCVTDSFGKIVFSIGDPDTKVFFRSCAKPIQALPLIRSGAAKALDFSKKDIAVACASHSGQSFHQDAVKGILSRIGLDETSLHCGIMEPYNQEENARLLKQGLSPCQIHSTCSGKHSAMLALAKFRGGSLGDYEKISNPVQQEILETVAEFTEEDASSIIIGTDGCGAPIYLLPIRKIALSYARLVMASKQPQNTWYDACKTVFESMTEYPEFVAGEGEFCTELMQSSGGKLIGKVGAEAVYCLGIRDGSLGIAVKIADGNERAVYPVVMQILKDLQILNSDELSKLSHWHTITLQNQLKEPVGTIQPCFSVGLPGSVISPVGKNITSLS